MPGHALPTFARRLYCRSFKYALYCRNLLHKQHSDSSLSILESEMRRRTPSTAPSYPTNSFQTSTVAKTHVRNDCDDRSRQTFSKMRTSFPHAVIHTADARTALGMCRMTFRLSTSLHLRSLATTAACMTITKQSPAKGTTA